MIFDFLFKKSETDEQRVIRWADTIVENSNYDGELNNECLDPFADFWRDHPVALPMALIQIRNEILSRQPQNNDGTTVNLDITAQYIQNNYDVVRNHLLNNGYIDKPDHTQMWVLNERGRKMKQLKGHKKYQNYIDKKLKSEIAEMNGKIYWLRRVVITAIVGAVVGYAFRYLTEPKQKTPTVQSSSEEKSRRLLPNQPEKTIRQNINK